MLTIAAIVASAWAGLSFAWYWWIVLIVVDLGVYAINEMADCAMM